MDLYVHFVHSVSEGGIMGNLCYHYTACDNNPILNEVYPHHSPVVDFVIEIKNKIFVEFEVHTVMCLRIGVFWDVRLCDGVSCS